MYTFDLLNQEIALQNTQNSRMSYITMLFIKFRAVHYECSSSIQLETTLTAKTISDVLNKTKQKMALSEKHLGTIRTEFCFVN